MGRSGFIPRTTTLGCTHEAMDFTAALQALRELGAKVLGVSRDPPASHKKFAEKHGMGLKLASEDVRQRELRPGFGLPFSSTREERSYKLNTP